MKKYEFYDWLEDLEVQTLTDDLKQTIKECVEDVITDVEVNSH